MKLKPIRSEAEYDAALRAIERYFNKPPRKGTPEADRFDMLAMLIEAYERVRWPIPQAEPVDVIRSHGDPWLHSGGSRRCPWLASAGVRGHEWQAATLAEYDSPSGVFLGNPRGSAGWSTGSSGRLSRP